MIDFNLNEYVLVKLNGLGIDISKKQHEELCDFYPSLEEFIFPVTDEEGWSKWQLWVLMNTFGEHLKMGFPLPFEATVKIDIKPSIKE